jgi:hypothetical protein
MQKRIVSDCCQATSTMPEFVEYGLCPECHEHCVFVDLDEPSSEDVAKAIVKNIAQELGRLCVQKNRDNRDLRRMLRRTGIDRKALNVPVFNKLGDQNENGNIIELVNVVDDSSDSDWL